MITSNGSHPTIVVTGAPASGKSTLVKVIMGAKIIPNCTTIGVDDILREMHGMGLLNGIAEINSEGALILSNRGPILAEAMQRLLDKRRSLAGPAIIESPIHEAFFTNLISDSEAASGTCVLCLESPLHIRLQRNDLRHRDRISTDGVIHMPAKLETTLIDQLKETTRGVRIFNSNRSIHSLRTDALNWLADLQHSKSSVI